MGSSLPKCTQMLLAFGLASSLFLPAAASAQSTFETSPIDSLDTWPHGWWTSVAIDANGVSHVAYSEQGISTTSYYLVYATNATGTWVNTPVPGSNGLDAQIYPSIALGPDGYPRIAYYDGRAGNLKLITKSAVGWSTPEVVEPYFNSGQYPHLVIDGTGGLHISMFRALGGTPDAPIGGLYYAHKAPGSTWHIEKVYELDNPPNSSPITNWCIGAINDIALLPDGTPHILFSAQAIYGGIETPFVGIARPPGNTLLCPDRWCFEVPDWRQVNDAALRIESDGTSDMAFTHNDTCFFQTQTAGVWQPPEVMGLGAKLVYSGPTPSNVMALAQRDNGLAIAYARNADIQLIKRGAFWSTQTAYLGSIEGYMSAALDPNHWAAITFKNYRGWYTTELAPSGGSGGGSGCPFVDVYTGTGWQPGNSILGRSTDGSYVTDMYHLEQAPSASDARVTLRLREDEQEVTKLNNVSLLVVDHSPGTHAMAIDGSIVLGHPSGPIRIAASDGSDVTAMLSRKDGILYQGGSADALILDGLREGGATLFEGDPSGKTRAGAGGHDDMRLPSSSDSDILKTTGIRIDRFDGQGRWVELRRIYPREYSSSFAFSSQGAERLRIVFLDRHDIDYLVSFQPARETPRISRLGPARAEHSRLGDVTADLEQRTSRVTELKPGDRLTLEFSTPPEPEVGLVRDYFLKSSGVYTSLGPVGNEQRAILQNYPNPFAGSTSIHFSAPARGCALLEVYDIFGRRIRTLVNDARGSGDRTVVWDGRDARGMRMKRGVYLSRLSVDGRVYEAKMLLMP